MDNRFRKMATASLIIFGCSNPSFEVNSSTDEDGGTEDVLSDLSKDILGDNTTSSKEDVKALDSDESGAKDVEEDTEQDAEQDSDGHEAEGDALIEAEPETGAEAGEDASDAGDVEVDTETCTPEDLRCNILTVEKCDPTGTFWDATDVCPYLCDNGTCIGNCVPNASKCDGLTVELCDTQAQWTVAMVCPHACLEGACVSCDPGETRCANVMTLETCNNQGSWEAEDCFFGCITGSCAECSPGERVCNLSNGSVKECDSSGHWGQEIICSGDYNATGSCNGQGECIIECLPEWADCTTAPGCESPVGDPACD